MLKGYAFLRRRWGCWGVWVEWGLWGSAIVIKMQGRITLAILSTRMMHNLIPRIPRIPIIPTAQLSLGTSETDTNIPGSTTQFLVRRAPSATLGEKGDDG